MQRQVWDDKTVRVQRRLAKFANDLLGTAALIPDDIELIELLLMKIEQKEREVHANTNSKPKR